MEKCQTPWKELLEYSVIGEESTEPHSPGTLSRVLNPPIYMKDEGARAFLVSETGDSILCIEKPRTITIPMVDYGERGTEERICTLLQAACSYELWDTFRLTLKRIPPEEIIEQSKGWHVALVSPEVEEEMKNLACPVMVQELFPAKEGDHSRYVVGLKEPKYVGKYLETLMSFKVGLVVLGSGIQDICWCL